MTTTSNAKIGILGLGPAGRHALKCFEMRGFPVRAWDENKHLPDAERTIGALDGSKLLVPTADAIIDRILDDGLHELPFHTYLPFHVNGCLISRNHSKTCRAWSVAEKLDRNHTRSLRFKPQSRMPLYGPPWLVRPLGGAGGGGQFWAHSEHEIGHLVANWEEQHGEQTWIVAPDLRSQPDYAVDMLYTRGGRLVYSFVRKRISTLDAKNRPSGLSSSARLAVVQANPKHRDALREIADRAVRALTVGRAVPRGPYGVDMRGQYVVEVNAGRFNTSAFAWSRAADEGNLASHLYDAIVDPERWAERDPITERDVALQHGVQWLLIEPGHDPIAFGSRR